ncbi:hypothetical protein BO70DRAFT_381772 [Aspergillus heteromorphus CBS 117.55]|uniref:GPI-anchored cell wall organization protein Ecm33 n=1 Tax=Aspergillus heteromorphus CBS 117.55 TaxID=1448321 RepID=A0A317VF77_9EURO|nr:uncharacterized protein BO70DRAFT_381772 [Aspergillus heteromorphus CBS 117.55]PWY73024.1 hypothetical protein BO70DRAFT_381772 [Aspergillus heteromorphus CBS 117.55]
MKSNRQALAWGMIASSVWGAFAQECTTSGGLWNFTSQASVDLVTHNCTILNGDVTVSPSYSGSLTLNNITNITGEIYYYQNQTVDLTSVDLPDLLYAGAVDIENTPSLTRLSAPKVTEVPDGVMVVIIANSSALVEFEFPELVDTNGVILFANISSVDLTSLESTQFVSMAGTGDGIALDFPSLREVGMLDLVLSFSSFSAPLLETIGTSEGLATGDGILLWSSGDPVDISFPKLTYVAGNIQLSENINSLSVPLLTTAATTTNTSEGGMAIYPAIPFTVDFTSLANASSILLDGNISSALFPVLETVDYIEITSTLPFNCSSYDAVQARAETTAFADKWFCNSTYTNTTSTTTKATKSDAGRPVPVGVGLSGCVVAAMVGLLGLSLW